MRNRCSRAIARRSLPPVCAALLLAGCLAGWPHVASGQRPPSTTADATTQPAIVQRGRVDARLDVNFSAMAVPSTVYVGQQVTYQIGVFLSRETSERLRRNPEFVPPDVRSMLAYDLPSSTRPLRREVDGRVYDVHVFQRALFPLTPGTHELAPARLTYSLPLSNSFFSREETHSARTGAVTVIAKEPPQVGRPVDFHGAVGRLTLAARVDTPSSRVGDPVTLVVSVRGVGNVSLFPRPQLALPWGDAVAGAERVAVDSGTVLIQGRKDFEWVVTPRREGTLEVPAVRYPYWNPYTETYEVAVTTPLPLRVTGGELAPPLMIASDSAPPLTLRARYRGALAPPLATSPVLWALLGVLPLPALVLGLRQRPQRVRPSLPAVSLQAWADGRPVDAATVRRVFAAQVAHRTGVDANALADGRRLVRMLQRVGVTADTATRTQVVLAEIDRATYGSSGSEPAGDLARRAAETYAAIDAEAIPRNGHGRGAGRVGAVTLLVAAGWLGGTGLARADQAAEASHFARGTALYERGEFVAAMTEFREITSRVPRAADAWANLGTSAWQASDTAVAAIGWQRALRLEPLAYDVRGRLESTPGFRPGLFGDVPPIPVDAAAALGVALWLVGWGALAWSLRTGRHGSRTASLVAIGSAGVVGVFAIALAEMHSGHDRVIVVEATQLRSAPALGAERTSEVLTGESGVEAVAQGVWRRVRFADGRSGWIESRRLASLDLSREP